MFRRASAATAMLVVALLAMTGCNGSPAPAESTPTFSSEEEAFAAAEATYRAYVDAVNSNRQNASSLPRPQDFLIGEALEADLSAQRELQAQGLSIVGPTAIRSTELVQTGKDHRDIELRACIDVSATAVLNADGADITPGDRPTLFALQIELTAADADLLISKSSSSKDQSC